MDLPTYFLRQPEADWGAGTLGDFERLYAESVAPGTAQEILYTLRAPKWQFLCYLCEHKNVVLHGSGNAHIMELEPNKSNDVIEFGNRSAIYAAADGIWPIYFAIVDRENYVTSLVNTCFRIVEAGRRSEPYYYFSINEDALPHAPWRNGTLYMLPGDTFEPQPTQIYRGVEIEHAQWAGLKSVRPLAKLSVCSDDFPFLAQMQGHDPAKVIKRATEDPDGFPWLEDTPPSD